MAITLLTTATVARRSGLSPSVLRAYEERELIRSRPTPDGRRWVAEQTLPRLAVIQLGRRLQIPLGELASYLADLPYSEGPGSDDWNVLVTRLDEYAEEQIRELHAIREDLTRCLSCLCPANAGGVAACPLPALYSTAEPCDFTA